VKGWTLAIETSGAPASIAIAREGEPPIGMTLEGPRADVARFLVPAIDDLARRAGVERARLARVVVGVGPGSYTGLRIGAAAARVLASASGAALAAHASTLSMAAAAPPGAPRIAVAIDALRGDLALALYERGERTPREAAAPFLVPGRDALRWLEERVVVSNRPDAVRASLPRHVEIVAVIPRADALLALDAAGAPPRADARPMYLRASAAEERARRG